MPNIYFETHGCSANLAESEMMMGLAEADGHKISSEQEADVIVINICTVKGDLKALRQIRNLNAKHPNKKIIVAGCIPRYAIPRIKEISSSINLINTYNLRMIDKVIKSSLNAETYDAMTYNSDDKVEIPRFRINPLVGIIPISSGCVSNCSFCSVKQIKGNIKSYPINSILSDIINSLKNGCREIWLTSQDNGCYGADTKTNLAELLREIVKIEHKFSVRIGMASPQHLIPYLSDLIEIMKSKKIFKFIHLPVQSGNNRILRIMKRDYTTETYKDILNKIRGAIPDITLATDVICGFPTETEEEFADTLNLIKEIMPDVLNISRYQPRAFTLSSNMRQLSGEILKNRTRRMTKLFNVIALEKNKNWIGWEGEIIINEIGKYDTFIGRNYAYKPVVVRGDLKIGDSVNVKIIDASSYDLRGDIIDYESEKIKPIPLVIYETKY